MFIVISKIIGILIAPANWLIALLLWLMLTKSAKTKKTLTFITLIGILFFGNEVIFNKLVNAWQPPLVHLNKNYEAGILLGGLGSFDKFGNGYLNTASDRLIATCTLYKQGHIKKIIISAGNIDTSKPNEALYLSERLQQLGVDPKDIVTEGRSRSTFENAAYTKHVLDSLSLHPPYVLITSALHIPRATAVFNKAGINVVAYPCNYIVIEHSFSILDYFVPKLYIINDWYHFTKEVLGLTGYRLFGKA